jgi:hypothetical protein
VSGRTKQGKSDMNSIFYLIGVVVVILAVLSLLGLR